MIVRFEQEYLKELFETGKCNDKKHRFQPEIVDRYRHRIDILMAVSDIEQLYRYGSFHCEMLKGDKSGIYSVRVNQRYRIEFNLSNEGIEPVVTVCNILELSNHYQR